MAYNSSQAKSRLYGQYSSNTLQQHYKNLYESQKEERANKLILEMAEQERKRDAELKKKEARKAREKSTHFKYGLAAKLGAIGGRTGDPMIAGIAAATGLVWGTAGEAVMRKQSGASKGWGNAIWDSLKRLPSTEEVKEMAYTAADVGVGAAGHVKQFAGAVDKEVISRETPSEPVTEFGVKDAYALSDEQLRDLSPEELEEIMSKLTPAQQEAFLRRYEAHDPGPSYYQSNYFT